MGWALVVVGVVGLPAGPGIVTDPPTVDAPASGKGDGGKTLLDAGDEKRVLPNSGDADAEEVSDGAAEADRVVRPDDAATTDGPSEANASCAQWVAPEPPRNCSKSGGNGNCSTTCSKGDTTWKSECKSAMCACRINDQTMCTCITTAVDGCGTCCPGMP
jgi:hypothetical protein